MLDFKDGYNIFFSFTRIPGIPKQTKIIQSALSYYDKEMTDFVDV